MLRLVSRTGGKSTISRAILRGGVPGRSSAPLSLRGFSAAAPADGEKPKGVAYSEVTVGIPKETFPLEKRVAASPESVARLVKPGLSVVIEDGAGEQSFFSNADYEAAGAKIDVFHRLSSQLSVIPPSTLSVWPCR